MTCDECPGVPTAQCDTTDGEIRKVSEEMFALDDNNAYEYLKVDTRAGEGRRYFWMGGKHFPRAPRRHRPPVASASSPILSMQFALTDTGAFSSRIKFHYNLHLLITLQTQSKNISRRSPSLRAILPPEAIEGNGVTHWITDCTSPRGVKTQPNTPKHSHGRGLNFLAWI